MKASDFIVEYLINQGITDVFGYPGGMVTHLMDSLGKYDSKIKTHITYHEQAASFAACGYAQASGKVGVAFATSGPGATNLITGIGNAFFDSIPTVYITGQVNTFESGLECEIRQRGFQETDIVSLTKTITKKSYYVEDVDSLPRILCEAFNIAQSGRKGPVLIDIPMDIFRTSLIKKDFNKKVLEEVLANKETSGYVTEQSSLKRVLLEQLELSKRPCIILGNGIKTSGLIENVRNLISVIEIPIVSSMLAVDVITKESGSHDNYYGFIGAYGCRTANFVVAKSDLIIGIGTRFDVRQVGGQRANFAPNAKIIRIDIDVHELEYLIREDEIGCNMDALVAIPILIDVLKSFSFNDWLIVCKKINDYLKGMDKKEPNLIVEKLGELVSGECGVVSDVGQHMIWVAQSFSIKNNQRLYFSGGMGSMGYALPAAIGVYYATRKPVVCFVGDGGFQMNIQELQFVYREQLPIKIILLNNNSLGMIRHFQEMYFDSNYYYTIGEKGYTVPDFLSIAKAYKIGTVHIRQLCEIDQLDLEGNLPLFIEVDMNYDTYVYPKLEYGQPNQDQEPLLDREIYDFLMGL